MQIHFTNNFPLSRVDEVIDFTLGPRLWISDKGYPDLAQWGQRLYHDLKHSHKQALIALDHNQVVGSIVYRRHAQDSTALEIRRITVHPSQQGRYVSDFLLRNTEIQAQQDFGASHVTVDSKTDAFGMIHFLIRNGYKITDKVDLYGLGAGDDFIYKKKLAPDLAG